MTQESGEREERRLSVTYGAFAPKPSEQIKGLLSAGLINRLSDNITYLAVHSILTEKETHLARKRLTNLISRRYLP